MRNLLCMICMMFICIYAKAQVMDDDFESNQYNWAERSSSKGIALIRDGVMHLESKSKPVTATCYAPFDVNKQAKLEIYKEDKLIGYKEEALKLRSGKKVGLEFEVEYNLNEIVYKVNGVRAMAYLAVLPYTQGKALAENERPSLSVLQKYHKFPMIVMDCRELISIEA